MYKILLRVSFYLLGKRIRKLGEQILKYLKILLVIFSGVCFKKLVLNLIKKQKIVFSIL